MNPSAEAQAIIDDINKLPGLISAEVQREVTTAEAAKDAQHAADLQGIASAWAASTSALTPPADLQAAA